MTTADRIYLFPYDLKWPGMAADEIVLLKNSLGIENIQHIGSTAIPGMMAKPVIDIMIGVKALEDAQRMIPILENLGYAYWRNNPKTDRLFFVKGLHTGRTHHVHIFEINSYEWLARQAFRDYLIAHDDVAAEYGQLKQNLAQKYQNDREKYTTEKTEFVKNIVQIYFFKNKQREPFA